MRSRSRFLVVAAVTVLLLLAACGGPKTPKCKTAADCFAADTSKSNAVYDAACDGGKCAFSLKSDVCGNGKWEPAADKDCAACAKDCTGIVAGSKYLRLTCVGDACVEGVASNNTKPIASSVELSAGGNRFRLDTVYPDPFNLKQDAFDFAFTLRTLATDVSDIRITHIEMSGTTPDKRLLTIGENDPNLPLLTLGAKGDARLALSFPSAGLDGQLLTPALSIDIGYRLKGVPKVATMKTTFKTSINWIAPRTEYPCPGCPAKPGYAGDCIAGTAICMYAPLTGACGNGICETGENKCTCTADCGPCSGAAGNYLDFACVNSECKGQLRAGVTIQPLTIVDDRDLGPFALHDRYLLENPFDVASKKVAVEMTLTSQDADVTAVTINTISLLEGTNEIAAIAPKKRLDVNALSRFDVTIPPQPKPEQDRTLTLSISYQYTKGDTLMKSVFTKPLGKITLLTLG